MGSAYNAPDRQQKSNSGKHWQVIPVTGCAGAIVDAADLALVSEYTWRLYDNKKGNRYAQTNIGGRVVRMHRMLLGLTDPSVHVDHKNGDGLDNRRENIRPCTHAQNVANKRHLKSGGVCRARNGWMVRVISGGVRHYIGRFSDRGEAEAAYIDAARRIHGEFSPV